jgi:prephenate dehydratase
MVCIEKIVAYLGPEGTYSGKAARIFAEKICARMAACGSLEEVASKVSQNVWGIFPYYSQLEGWVSDSLKIIHENQFQIIDAHRVPVKPSVGIYPGTNAKEQVTAYSHRKALALCSAWLTENYPLLKHRIPVKSTAAAAERVSKEHSGLAIADIEALHICGLDVVNNEIATSFTDFYVATPEYGEIPKGEGDYRTAIMITPRAGEVGKTGVMQYIVNLFGIHNRPIIKSISVPRSYALNEPDAQTFFFEFEGHTSDEATRKLISQLPLSSLIDEVKVLGSYPKLTMHTGILTAVKAEIPKELR